LTTVPCCSRARRGRGRPAGRLLPALLLLPVAACTGDRGGAGEVARRGGTLVVAAAADLDHANPLVTVDVMTQELLRYALFLPLLRHGADFELEPGLAEAWTLEGDSAVVFRLRRDVAWHDGTPTTAWDVAFTFERALDPETAFPNRDWLDGWHDVAVVDSFTVRVRIDARPDILTGVPLLPVVPRHALQDVPPAQLRQAPFNRAPIGNGPFRFVEVRAGERWVFEANGAFPAALGGRPHVDRLVWRVIPDGTAQIAELRTNAAHIALGARVEQVLETAELPGFMAIERASRRFAFIGWNHRRPPLGDARVRRALMHAIDRPSMIALLRGGHGTLANGPIGAFHWSHDATLEPLAFDRDAALALLAGAGLRDRSGDGFLERPDGRPFVIELKVPAASGFNRDMAELVRSDLAAIGVRVNVRPTDGAVLVADITSARRDFDAVLMGWESDLRLNLRSLLHSAARDEAFQIAGYANPAVDSILDRTAAITDREAARPDLVRLQRILRDEQPWGWLYWFPDLYVASTRLRGADMDVRGVLVNLPGWWLEDAPAAPAQARGG
jgi:peptide/nickel transport system substrate-binding protein